MVIRTLLRSATLAVLVASGLALPSSAASASEPAAVTPQHCVTALETGQTACFSTITEADSYATGQYTAQSIPPEDDDRDWRAVRLFDRTGFRTGGRGTHLFTIEGPRCSESYARIDLSIAHLGPISRHASSVKTFNNCDVRFWGRSEFRGRHSVWIHRARNLGNIGSGWSDRARSLRIS